MHWPLYILSNLILIQICISVVSKSRAIRPANSKVLQPKSSSKSSQPSLFNKIDQLITNPDVAEIKIAEDRFILPGDYVVSKEYGIGRYKGLKMVDLTPTKLGERNYQPTVIVEYKDGEVSWFLRLIQNELYLYQFADVGEVALSTLINQGTWKRRKSRIEKASNEQALNLIRLMAIRNSFHRTPCAPDNKEKYERFEQGFAFTPTHDQLQCFQDIEHDMVRSTRPMDRLICGDVGFGKTEVAMRAIYRAVLSKRQVALLVPSKALASQHLRTLRTRMPEASIELLRGGDRGNAKATKEAVKSGKCQVVIGTHALLYPSVSFDNLGLLVIDEEQKFGVNHKEKLKAASGGCDVLTLSATPIPRTLQMSMSGLKDFSLLNSPPTGRKEVAVNVGKEDDVKITAAITAELARGGQVFVVVPFVRDVDPTSHRIMDLVPGVSIIQAHGQHKDDLEDRIESFANKDADILVATTVIENGIDLPNVNTIIILSANRFGMSSLYQLRGRVGRSTTQAYAYFMFNTTTVDGEERLTYIQTHTKLGSGYDLARRDLEMRGAGTTYGTDQSGSTDVGLDLQTAILRGAVEALKEENIISVPESRIELGVVIEAFYKRKLGPIPPIQDLNAVACWEADLVTEIVGKFAADLQVKREQSAVAVVEKVDEPIQIQPPLKAKRKKKQSTKEFDPNSPDVLIRDFLAANSIEALDKLEADWERRYGEITAGVREIMSRTKARITSRRLGIVEIARFNEDIQFTCTSLNKIKWKTFKNTGCIPLQMLSRMAFIPCEENDRLIEDTAVTGTLVLKDVFTSAEAMKKMPKDILEFLIPFAQYADEQLEEIVKRCDPEATSTLSAE